MTRRELLWLSFAAACKQACPDLSEGSYEGMLPFVDQEGVEFGVPLSEGIVGHLFLDLSTLTEAAMAVPANCFYIRTMAPELPEGDWVVHLEGLIEEAVDLPIAEIIAAAVDQGEVVMECSGNTATAAYGLLSATTWKGMPFAQVLERVRPTATDAMIEIVGVDYAEDSGTSIAGCSWIFSPEVLADAFLATEMEGAPLSVDHGAPVRLVIPNCYGCCNVKWVQQIRWVSADTPATAQMQEFAARTHQDGVPALARDYIFANMDPAALPVRIEVWRIGRKRVFRVIGILWGGPDEVTDLRLSINDAEAVPVDVLPGSVRSWRLWYYCWEAEPGAYELTLSVYDPGVRTRRLDSKWYKRSIIIPEDS